MTTKQLTKIAKLEVEAWGYNLPRGLALAILFSFIHRVTTGETVEETFFQKGNYVEPDYEI
jgi:hypothetical protein